MTMRKTAPLRLEENERRTTEITLYLLPMREELVLTQSQRGAPNNLLVVPRQSPGPGVRSTGISRVRWTTPEAVGLPARQLVVHSM